MGDKVVHFEIPADDVDRAQRFYKEAFGWGIASEPGHDYWLLTTAKTDPQGRPEEAGAINGGLLRRQDPIRSIVITVKVPDLEKALGTVQKLGGSVVRRKQPVGPIGFAAYIKDSEGNVIGLFQDANT